jgi:hypothetical protein
VVFSGYLSVSVHTFNPDAGEQETFMGTLRSFWARLAVDIKYDVRLYFAPLTGAVRGIRAEFQRIEQERQAALATYDDDLTPADLAWVRSQARARMPRGKVLSKRSLLPSRKQ